MNYLADDNFFDKFKKIKDPILTVMTFLFHSKFTQQLQLLRQFQQPQGGREASQLSTWVFFFCVVYIEILIYFKTLFQNMYQNI